MHQVIMLDVCANCSKKINDSDTVCFSATLTDTGDHVDMLIQLFSHLKQKMSINFFNKNNRNIIFDNGFR